LPEEERRKWMAEEAQWRFGMKRPRKRMRI
jgi:hypothetical protein